MICQSIAATVDAVTDYLAVPCSFEGLLILRYLFGLPSDPSGSLVSSGESLSEIELFMKTSEEKICQSFENSMTAVGNTLLHQVYNITITPMLEYFAFCPVSNIDVY